MNKILMIMSMASGIIIYINFTTYSMKMLLCWIGKFGKIRFQFAFQLQNDRMIDCIVSDRCNCCTNIKFAYRSVSQNISKCHILIWDQIQGHIDRLLSILKIYISVWVGQVAMAYISP